MTKETLYRMSWEPLSEADKSSDQFVRYFEGDERMSYFSKASGMWSDEASGGYIRNPEDMEFLCLEPVEVEPVKRVWEVFADDTGATIAICSTESKANEIAAKAQGSMYGDFVWVVCHIVE